MTPQFVISSAKSWNPLLKNTEAFLKSWTGDRELLIVFI